MDGDLAIRTDGYGDATLHDELPIARNGVAPAAPDAAPDVSAPAAEAEPVQAVGTEGVPAIVFGTPAAESDAADAVAADAPAEAVAAETEAGIADGAAEAVAADAVADAVAEQDAADAQPDDGASLAAAIADMAAASETAADTAPADADAALVAADPAVAPEAAEAEAPAVDLVRLEGLLESLLLAAGSPVPLARLVEVVDGPARRDVVAALKAMGARYETEGRGLRLVHVGGGWQLRSAPEHGPFVRKLLGGRPPRLSRAMLETLAIVAYRQPCTKPEIEAIRGVDADATLNTLLERRMVRITGRKDAPGRPLLYATTREFLEVFGLPDLNALPPLAELGSGAELLTAPDLTVGPGGVHPTPAAELGFRGDANGAAADGTAASVDDGAEANGAGEVSAVADAEAARNEAPVEDVAAPLEALDGAATDAARDAVAVDDEAVEAVALEAAGDADTADEADTTPRADDEATD